ncbi:MAG: amidohydrolase family protein [Phycisphaerales bacterium]|nr:amidohydrolase family protein [Phycisphaerales bacterium]
MPSAHPLSPANRLGLNYSEQAIKLGAPAAPIIDVHTHLRGDASLRIYADVAEQFGVTQTWTMTQLSQVESVRSILGDSVRFIAQPDFRSDDLLHAMGEGYLEHIARFHDLGAHIVKFWSAPRARDMGLRAGLPNLMDLDGPVRREQMQLAADRGMAIMTHVADPDTWFQTHYADDAKYGTKSSQYVPLERALDEFPVPWIAAHMGGWPEDLLFLSGLLARHPNLHLDTSATKWMVRTLSAHDRDSLLEFLERWSGRILFGSDIVVQEDHVSPDATDAGRGSQAASSVEAFDLYASRYWSLRTLFETTYDGESPIADPDLHMVSPETFDPFDAPALRGKSLPPPLLRMLYHDAAATFARQFDSN